jgi:hypothetical protein
VLYGAFTFCGKWQQWRLIRHEGLAAAMRLARVANPRRAGWRCACVHGRVTGPATPRERAVVHVLEDWCPPFPSYFPFRAACINPGLSQDSSNRFVFGPHSPRTPRCAAPGKAAMRPRFGRACHRAKSWQQGRACLSTSEREDRRPCARSRGMRAAQHTSCRMHEVVWKIVPDTQPSSTEFPHSALPGRTRPRGEIFQAVNPAQTNYPLLPRRRSLSDRRRCGWQRR